MPLQAVWLRFPFDRIAGAVPLKRRSRLRNSLEPLHQKQQSPLKQRALHTGRAGKLVSVAGPSFPYIAAAVKR
jgi:hypothetical protein